MPTLHIIDDDDIVENNIIIEEKKPRKKSVVKVLEKFYMGALPPHPCVSNTTEMTYTNGDNKGTKSTTYGGVPPIEIGVDEAGRGPMMGRVYTAAVILPKDDSFNHSLMKDSKKFHSEKKIREAADYIKKNALAWCVTYSDEAEVDEFNIRNATHKSMHKSIKGIMKSDNYSSVSYTDYHLLIDGNDFKPFLVMDDDIGIVQVKHTCIEGGDNKYTAIAAASILAKVSRDTYIEELCKEHPYLNTNYDLLKNKGYGTPKHMAGIREHGISPFHRKTFGLCREATF